MSKKKLARIIAACIIACFVIGIIYARTSTPTYTLSVSVNPPEAGSVSPSGGEYESGLQITLAATPASGYTFDYWDDAASGSSNTVTITMNSNKTITAHFKEEPEPAIPAHLTTYTDELGLFSISYPPEWELALEVIEEAEQAAKDIVSSIASDLPVEEVSLLFLAGLPTITGGYIPGVSIAVEPLLEMTHDEVVTAAIEGLKAVMSDYHEFSRVKTTIDNRTATIIEWQGTVAGLGTYRCVQMIFLVSKTAWVVNCTALPDEYSKWEDDFDAIVRSLRILK
jgi:uncharacterized repeat protein (TIGR02543 family)